MYTACKNILGKGEVASNKHFLHFPHLCFVLNQIIVSPFVHISDIVSLVAFKFEEPKFGISIKGLTLYQTTKLYTSPNSKGKIYVTQKLKFIL